jgi:hypothetical protein
MSISSEYQKNLNDAARSALLSVVANHPSTSVADLRELISEHPELGGVTLSELVGQGGGGSKGAKPGPAKQSKKSSAVAAASKPVARPGKGPHAEWNTRTNEGRAELDRAVIESLSAFGGVGVSAEAIRARVGATPAQIRESLNRHIEAGEVSFSGKARGTRYTLEA